MRLTGTHLVIHGNLKKLLKTGRRSSRHTVQTSMPLHIVLQLKLSSRSLLPHLLKLSRCMLLWATSVTSISSP